MQAVAETVMIAVVEGVMIAVQVVVKIAALAHVMVLLLGVRMVIAVYGNVSWGILLCIIGGIFYEDIKWSIDG